MINLTEQAALKVMGWTDGYWIEEAQFQKGRWLDNNGDFIMEAIDWNPLEDWNQLRQLQEKVIEDGKWEDYIIELTNIVDEFLMYDSITRISYVFRDATPAQHIEAMLRCYD